MVKDVVYRRGRSVVSALHVHLVFVTKYRRGVFTARALDVLRESMGEDDHVHPLCS